MEKEWSHNCNKFKYNLVIDFWWWRHTALGISVLLVLGMVVMVVAQLRIMQIWNGINLNSSIIESIVEGREL